MAKPPAKTEQTALATTQDPAVPAFLGDKVAQDAGKGVSTLAEDNLVPLIYILQAQSPQCNKRSPDYVEDAESGSIWLRNSGLPAINGEDGMLFQPCFFQKDWVEWIPRGQGGGYVGRHQEKPSEAVEKNIDPQNPDKMAWVLPNGNTVVETRYHIGYVFLEGGRKMPYVIPMSSSAHTASRGWMFLMNSRMVGDAKAPSWAGLYRLKTKEKTNKSGTWFTWDITDAGWVQTEQDYIQGAELHESFAIGERQIAAEEDTGQESHAADPNGAM
jgi:hypothetical protein